jgi:hypothetical protein
MYNDGTEKNIAATAVGCVEVQRPTLTERLKQERLGISIRLNELDAAINALEANPQVQTILDLVQKVARY